MSTLRNLFAQAALAVVMLLLPALSGCGDEEAAKDKPAAKDTKPGAKDTEPGAKDTKPGGKETTTPAATKPGADPVASAAAASVDPDLKEKLAKHFADAKTFENVIKKVKGGESAISALGDKGKTTYPQYLAAAEALPKISEQVAAEKFGEMPPLVVNGYVAGLMTVKLIATAISAAGKKAAQAGRRLDAAKAKKHGKYAKSLAPHAKVAKVVLKRYAEAVEMIITSKSDYFRLSVFDAAVKAHAKADAHAQGEIASLLKRLHGREKDGEVKDKMDELLKKL